LQTRQLKLQMQELLLQLLPPLLPSFWAQAQGLGLMLSQLLVMAASLAVAFLLQGLPPQQRAGPCPAG
jgi:hypothetical protein